MVEIIGIKFSSGGKTYFFDPVGKNFEYGAQVLVETARGVEMGKVVTANKMVEESEVVTPLKPIIRLATEEDIKQDAENRIKEKEAFDLAAQQIIEHKMDMKLVGAEYTFDRSKIMFYFTADGRVDFRELVKSLALLFKTRIELRQIGVRDEARQLGGLGICGRPLCCKSFLLDFQPVSIKMAKEQGLSLNPTKISGVCGRLMCCLQYEQNAYEDMLKKLPARGSKVETPDGEGIVADVATLKGEIKVRFNDSNGELIKFENYKLGEFKCNKRCQNCEADAIDEAEVVEEPEDIYSTPELVSLEDSLKENSLKEESLKENSLKEDSDEQREKHKENNHKKSKHSKNNKGEEKKTVSSENNEEQEKGEKNQHKKRRGYRKHNNRKGQKKEEGKQKPQNGSNNDSANNGGYGNNGF